MVEQYYGYIYKVTNVKTGKIYIGQKHKAVFDPNYYGSGILLKNELKKYGKSNFTISVLEYCNTPQELNKREVFYINKYNSTNTDIGYNIDLGGKQSNTPTSTSIKQAESARGRKAFIRGKKCMYRKINVVDYEVTYVDPIDINEYLDEGYNIGNPLITKSNINRAKKYNGRYKNKVYEIILFQDVAHINYKNIEKYIKDRYGVCPTHTIIKELIKTGEPYKPYRNCFKVLNGLTILKKEGDVDVRTIN